MSDKGWGPLLNHLLCDPFLIEALYRAFLIELLYYDFPVSQSVCMCGTDGVAWALEQVTTLQKILRVRVIIMIVENWATVSVLSEVHSSKRAQFDAQSLGFWDTYFWIVRRILLYFEAHIFEVSWVGPMATSHKNININICWIDLKNQLFRQVLKNQLQLIHSLIHFVASSLKYGAWGVPTVHCMPRSGANVNIRGKYVSGLWLLHYDIIGYLGLGRLHDTVATSRETYRVDIWKSTACSQAIEQVRGVRLTWNHTDLFLLCVMEKRSGVSRNSKILLPVCHLMVYVDIVCRCSFITRLMQQLYIMPL